MSTLARVPLAQEITTHRGCLVCDFVYGLSVPDKESDGYFPGRLV
jgi:hypothetical protein